MEGLGIQLFFEQMMHLGCGFAGRDWRDPVFHVDVVDYRMLLCLNREIEYG